MTKVEGRKAIKYLMDAVELFNNMSPDKIADITGYDYEEEFLNFCLKRYGYDSIDRKLNPDDTYSFTDVVNWLNSVGVIDTSKNDQLPKVIRDINVSKSIFYKKLDYPSLLMMSFLLSSKCPKDCYNLVISTIDDVICDYSL